jgi:hypothetical protein
MASSKSTKSKALKAKAVTTAKPQERTAGSVAQQLLAQLALLEEAGELDNSDSPAIRSIVRSYVTGKVGFDLLTEMEECAGELEAHNYALAQLCSDHNNDLQLWSVHYALGHLFARMRAVVDAALPGRAAP